ncbi:major facilitator superfamily transporter [Ceratobasidium sp. AG-Ba]|nr:major facilitator superfamily transporter [Ceratobasidium sp. AG-Ba]
MWQGFGIPPSDVGTWTGILVSVFFISQFATSLIWASIAERFGRRAVLFTSLVGSGLTCVAFGTSKSLGFAIGVRLLQGAFGGAVGVARGSVASISDPTNEAQAYAILGFCWGFGGVGGAIIGGAFDHPAQKWSIFAHTSLLVEFPYLLPTIVAASITVAGGLLALSLNPDGGPRAGALFDCETDGPSDCEPGLETRSQSQAVPARQQTTENEPLRQTRGVENYGSIEHPAPAEQAQTEPRLGVPLGERTWTQSSAVSGGSGYGDIYRSRFGGGVRRRSSWISAVARRHMGVDDGLGGRENADNEPTEYAPRLAERILMANELTVSSIGDLWVASALTMDAEEEEESQDWLASGPGAENTLASQHSSAMSEGTTRATPLEPRARSVSAGRRTVRSFSAAPYRNTHPYSLALSVDNSSSRLAPSSYPAIMQNPGLSSPSPTFSFLPDGPDASGAPNLDVLQPIIEGKPVGFGTEESDLQQESVLLQLPLTMIFQYGLLALHSTTHDQVFMSYLVSNSDRGGLSLDAGDFAQLSVYRYFTYDWGAS